ncbi:2,6-dihydropseudooxynicotine hydrolase [Thozetella sp. PMI_491]|nr:2,6-dihydropseudooxynicotine hydrolase [Thozetella sp. PMI_491]
MLQLNKDSSFNYELLRNLGHSRYHGADVSEVLTAAASLRDGDVESFYDAFNNLAVRVNSQAEAIDAVKYPVSARDAFFRASTYFRAADFYLHGNPDDPRLNDLWDKQLAAFNKAIALLPIPGERVTLRSTDDAFDVPAIFYRAAGAGSQNQRPTLILGNGYDGALEEMLHVLGFAALERGYNVMTYEGPGQPTVRRQQNVGFIPQWERAVTPLVDYLVAQSEVDSSRIGLMGYSMGGWLAIRAAAFEHRLAAVMAVDGVYNVFQAYYNQMPPPMQAIYDTKDFDKANQMIKELLGSGKAPIGLKWGIEQGIWSFCAESASDFMEKTREFTLEGIAHLVQCPAWIGEAADDLFFYGQPEQVKEALGSLATYRSLTSVDGASHHCHVGATAYLNQILCDWFDQVTSSI